jgi:oxygen-independent coproporphyrinogen-3 oxidase
VHGLFCLRRCPYCDFNIAIYRDDHARALLGALQLEIDRYAELPWAGQVPAATLFLGGGTPSLLPPDALGALVDRARARLGLQPDAEVTLEANPEGLDVERLQGFRAAGVTRLSLGVQALDDDLLARLGRMHGAADARRAFRLARAAGFDNVSVDLLYGCPGQDLRAFTLTLDEVLAWEPEHLSAYALTIEPKTPFGRRPPHDLPDEEAQIAQWVELLQRTERAGFRRYEVSNFARPGFQSRHNLLYWTREDYVGLGPGAHGGIGATRVQNLRSQVRWRRALEAGRWPFERQERLTPRQVLGERVVLGLRLTAGVPREWLVPLLLEARPPGRTLDDYVSAGLLAVAGDQVHLTPRGVLVSDAVFAELI